MKTITSKDLRGSLDKTFDAVNNGEDIVITHRFKKAVRLTRVASTSNNKSALAGLAKFDAAPKKLSPYSSTQSLKELYKNSIEQKYGK